MGDAAPVSVRGDMRLVVAEGEAAEAERRLELVEKRGEGGIGAGEEVGCGRDFGVEEIQGVAVLAEEANTGEVVKAG